MANGTTTKNRLINLAEPAPEFQGMTIDEATRGQFERGVDINISSLKRGVFGAQQLLGEAVGNETFAEQGRAGVQREQETAAGLPPLAQPRATQVDWTSFDDVSDWVGGALGQAAPSLVAAAGAGALAAATGGGALPVLAAAGLTSAVPEAGSTYLDILEETGERRPGTAALTGAAAGALDAFGAGRVARAAIPDSVLRELVRAGVDPATLQRLGLRQTGAGALKRAGEAGLTEAGTEAAQGAVGDIGRTAGGIEGLDPLDIERRVDEAAIGLVAGGTVGGAPSAVSLGIERARDRSDRQEASQEATEQARRARQFTPEGQQRADFEVSEEGVARRSRRFDPTGRPFTDQPGSISDFDAPEGTTDLAAAPHIVEGGDTDIKYSRGLQGVERALAEGRIVLGDKELARVKAAAERARAALENPDTELTDKDISDIKTGFEYPAVQAIFTRAKKLEDDIRSGKIDTSRGMDEAVDRPDVRFEPVPDNADPEIQDNLTVSDVVQIEQNRYILPHQGTAPLVTAEAAQAAASQAGVTDTQINDGLQKQVDKLNAKSKKEFYQRVPFTEVVESQAREVFGSNLTPQALTDLKNSRATEMFNEMSRAKEESGRASRFSVLDLFDPQNPGAWLGNFGAIKQIGQEPTRQALDLPENLYEVVKVETDADGNFVGGEKAVFKTVPKGTAFSPQGSNIGATLNGRRVQLNLMNLINKARGTLTKERQDKGLTLFERTHRDFNTAISSLLNDPNNDVEIDFNAIPPQTVAYRTADGIEFTYKQLTTGQTLDQQLDDMRERVAKVQRAVQLEQDNLATGDAGATLNVEARKRLSRFQRQEAALLKNIKGLEIQKATTGSEAPPPAEEFDGDTEVSGVIDQTAPQQQEEVRRRTADERGFEQEPPDTGELRRSPQDVSVEAAAAYEIIRRRGLLSGATLKNFDSWMDFVDKAFDRAGIPAIDSLERAAYNPHLVAKKLRKAAGAGTIDPAIRDVDLRLMETSGLLEIALGRKVTEQKPATSNDAQAAIDSHVEAAQERADSRIRRFVRENHEDFFGEKTTEDKVIEFIGGEGNLKTTVDFAAPERRDFFLNFIKKDKGAIQTRAGVEKLIADVNKALGVEHPGAALMSLEESINRIADSEEVPMSQILDGSFGGFFNAELLATGRPAIFVNPFLDPITAAQVALHEYGHLLATGADITARKPRTIKGAVKNVVDAVKGDTRAQQLSRALSNVNKEYEAYKSSVMSDLSVSFEDVVLSRQPGALSRQIAGSVRDSNVPFANLPETFKQYFISRDEWLADRIAAQLSRTEGVDNVIQNYLDSFKNAYADIIFGEYPQDNSGVSEMFEIWLPSNKKLREHTDKFMSRPPDAAPDPGMMFSRAAEATPAEDSETFRRLNDLTEKSLGISLQELAEAWVPDGTFTKHQVMSKLLMMAQTDMKMAESVLHNQMMRYALAKMLKPQEIQLLGNVATSDFVIRQLQQRLAGNEEALAQLNDPEVGVEAAVAYAYQFSVTDPSFKLGAKPRSLYHKIHRYLSELLAIINDSDSANLVFHAFWEGSRVNVDRAGDAGGAFKAYEQHIFGPDAQLRETKAFAFEKWYRRANPISSSQSKIQGFKNPTLSRLSDQFHRSIGRTEVGRTFFEERTIQTGEYMARVHEAMNNLTQEEVLELGALVRNFTGETRRAASPAARKAAEDIYLLMDDMFTYLKEAGVDIGQRGDEVQVRGRSVRAYFPWRFDPTAIMVNAGRLREVLKRPEYAKQINKMVNQRMSQGVHDVTADSVIDSIMNSVLNAGGAADVHIDDNVDSFAPGMDSFMKRELWWLMADSDPTAPISEDSRAQWSGAFDQNVYNTLENYVDQGVKRAAFTRRFGKKGEKLTATLMRAVEAGATTEEIQYAQHYVQSMLGSYGRMTHMKVNTAINWASEKLGKGKIVPEHPQELINPKFAKFTQVMIAYQNLRVLDFAVFSSLIDPAGIAARSGSLSNAWQSMRDGVKSWRNHYWKNNPDYLASVGEMLGITEAHLTNEAIQQEYGGTWMNGRAKKANDALFKYSGLNGWTRMTRLMAVSSAMKFLQFHTNTPTEQSAEFLSDLGLRADDLDLDSFDADGNVMIMDIGTRAALQSGKTRDGTQLIDKTKAQKAHDKMLLDRDNRLRTALIRYTNESILRPNAAQRPVWASDPHWALMFHLKQFMWSFTEVILNNAAHQAKNGNYAPMMMVGTLFPLGMGASDALRDWLRYGSDGAPSMKGATLSDYAWRAVQRSGITGFNQLGLDAAKDIQYGGVGIESFLGPSVNQALDLLEVPTSSNKTLLDFIDRATPLQNTTKVLEHWAW